MFEAALISSCSLFSIDNVISVPFESHFDIHCCIAFLSEFITSCLRLHLYLFLNLFLFLFLLLLLLLYLHFNFTCICTCRIIFDYICSCISILYLSLAFVFARLGILYDWQISFEMFTAELQLRFIFKGHTAILQVINEAIQKQKSHRIDHHHSANQIT